MKKDENKLFLEWLSNRLKYKYQEQDIEIINNIYAIINNKHIISSNIDNSIIENICRKYHADWDFDECELNFGHSEESRNSIKTYITNIIKDYINEICFAR